LIRCSREDFEDYSLYKGEIPLNKIKKGKPVRITLKLATSAGAPEKQNFEYDLKRSIIVREITDFPCIKVAKENSRIVYNLGAPRLGGPIRVETGPGPVLKVNGKIGDNYRVRLSNIENGFINQNEVQIMPQGTKKPSYFITSMSCGPAKGGDILTIPYPEPVPYEIYPDPDQKRIVITLFGVETSSTWITHLTGRKIIDKVTWEQTTPETYKIYVNLKTGGIWGYSFRNEGKRLVLRIKDQPVYDLSNVKPLTGLKIAIEAGHGGSGLGAVGLSGLLEKDVNLDLSLKLGELLKTMGAEIVQVRDSDRDMTLFEKRNIVVSSNADLFVSIHANAGGGGYLRVAGTSTYYNNPFWAPLAETIYDRLLELKLKEFGVVGSFNYTPIRLSEMPSILVEQAFMSNAEDEEKLADSQFRQQMAQKICEGMLDYLKVMREY
jgi:N-acetylmuramoyl-L-alanine amidase